MGLSPIIDMIEIGTKKGSQYENCHIGLKKTGHPVGFKCAYTGRSWSFHAKLLLASNSPAQFWMDIHTRKIYGSQKSNSSIQ